MKVFAMKKNRILRLVATQTIILLFALHKTAYNNPLSTNALSVLQTENISVKSGPANFQPDISYLFADLKFDGDSLKVCELGPSPQAGNPPSKHIINGQKEVMYSPYWSIFWHYLKQFNLPVWCVGGADKIDLDELRRCGGNYISDYSELWSNSAFQLCAQKQSSHKFMISDFAAIVVFAKRATKNQIKYFKEQHPNVLVINEHTGIFASNKDVANPLFCQNDLAQYKPRCGIYPKIYTPELAQDIIADLGTDTFIIKPIGSLQSNGVIMVTQQDLDEILRLIITKDPQLKKSQHRSLQHWRFNKKSSFIVEAYASSKTLWVKCKPYDPTMRLVFCLSHENGITEITVLGGFWKIPLKNLNERASLTEKHITIPYSGEEYIGLAISERDMAKAKGLLTDMLSKLYPKMLDIANSRL